MLRKDPDVVARRMQEEIVLVHLRTNKIYTLNATAARFWELLGTGLEREEIKRALQEEFEVEGPVLDEELEALIAELTSQGLLEADASV
jgi:hypothetical protein